MMNLILYSAIMLFCTSLFHMTTVGNGVKRVFAALSQTTVQSAVSIFPVESGEGSTAVDNSDIKPFFLKSRATSLVQSYFDENLPQYFWTDAEYQVDCFFANYQATLINRGGTFQFYPQRLEVALTCSIDGFCTYSDSKAFTIKEN